MHIEVSNVIDVLVRTPEYKATVIGVQPRLEICCPKKLERMLDRKYLNCAWSFLDMEVAWVPYSDPGFQTLGFFVMGPMHLFHAPPKNKADLVEWINTYWSVRYLITVPIFYDDNSLWSVRNYQNFLPVHLSVSQPAHKITFMSLYMQTCYTVCNGLTYLIGLERLGYFEDGLLLDAIKESVIGRTTDVPFTFLDTPDQTWQQIYNNHPSIIHLAEAPGYYAFRHKNKELAQYLVKKLSTQKELSIQYDLGYYNTINPLSCMWPYAKPKDFEMYMPTYPENNVSIYSPDFYALTENLTSSRAVWKWWVHKGGAKMTFDRLKNLEPEKHFEYLIKDHKHIFSWWSAIFTLYNKGSVRVNVRRSRLVRLWKMVTDEFFGDYTNALIQYLMDCPYSGPVSYPPTLFLKWIISRVNTREKKPFNITVNTLIAHDIQIFTDSDFCTEVYTNHDFVRRFSGKLSLLDILRAFERYCPNPNTCPIVLFKHWLEKRKTTKLLSIKTFFGLQEENLTTDDPELYIIGTVFMDYLLDHPEKLDA